MKSVKYLTSLPYDATTSIADCTIDLDGTKDGKPAWSARATLKVSGALSAGESQKTLAQKLRALADKVESDPIS